MNSRSENLRMSLETKVLWVENSHGLKRGTVYQIVRIISNFPLKLWTQFWNYFHIMALSSVGSDYY